jgi:transposase
MHTDEGTIKKVLMYLLDGKSIRETAEEVGLDKDTVQRIWKRVVEKWEKAVREFLEDINLHDVEFENLLSFPPMGLWRTSVNKKRKKKESVYWLPARVEF